QCRSMGRWRSPSAPAIPVNRDAACGPFAFGATVIIAVPTSIWASRTTPALVILMSPGVTVDAVGVIAVKNVTSPGTFPAVKVNVARGNNTVSLVAFRDAIAPNTGLPERANTPAVLADFCTGKSEIVAKSKSELPTMAAVVSTRAGQVGIGVLTST